MSKNLCVLVRSLFGDPEDRASFIREHLFELWRRLNHGVKRHLSEEATLKQLNDALKQWHPESFLQDQDRALLWAFDLVKRKKDDGSLKDPLRKLMGNFQAFEDSQDERSHYPGLGRALILHFEKNAEVYRRSCYRGDLLASGDTGSVDLLCQLKMKDWFSATKAVGVEVKVNSESFDDVDAKYRTQKRRVHPWYVAVPPDLILSKYRVGFPGPIFTHKYEWGRWEDLLESGIGLIVFSPDGYKIRAVIDGASGGEEADETRRRIESGEFKLLCSLNEPALSDGSVNGSSHLKGVGSKWRAAKESAGIKGAPQLVNLWCGLGGLALGLNLAGYALKASVDDRVPASEDGNAADRDPVRANFPHATHLRGHQASAECVKQAVKGEVDLLAGVVPCQGFSLTDPHTSFLAYLEVIVQAMRPGNVLLLFPVAAKTKILPKVQKCLESVGYNCQSQQLNVAEYGVPVQRRLLCLLASNGQTTFQVPVPSRTKDNYVTVRETIGNLPEPSHSQVIQSVGRALRLGQDPVFSSIRLLDPSKPAKAMLHESLHFSTPRRLTLREMARLQTFPDNYSLGEAENFRFRRRLSQEVPVLLAKELGLMFNPARRLSP